MSSTALIYGTPVRRSDFFVKTSTRIVCRSGHEQASAGFLFCPMCGKKYVSEDVITPTSHVERLMHEEFVNNFDDWWDGVRGDNLNGDPGVVIWRADPYQREDDYLRYEKDWDSVLLVLGMRISEFDASRAANPGARAPSITDLLHVDRQVREALPRWGVAADAECRLYSVLYTR